MSVDLDYNYVAHAERETMLADRSNIEATLAELARRLGHRIQWSKEGFAGRKLFATYRSVLGPNERVEVDLNFLFRQPLEQTRHVTMWQPGGLDRPRVRIVSPLELCIGKLLALLDRAAPRDAWDAVRLPQVAGKLLETARFRAFFVAMSAILDHPLPTYSRARMRRQLTPSVIANQLGPMLASGELPDAAALAEDAWRVAAPLVDLTPDETVYVEAAGGGELRTDLLFPEQRDLAAAVADHPALRWKAENAKQGGRVRRSRPNAGDTERAS
jgi:hypothetical protein